MILSAGIVHTSGVTPAAAATIEPTAVSTTIASSSSTSAKNIENITTTSQASTTKMASLANLSQTPIVHTNDGVEESVESYFADEPLMVHIAKCESHFTQYSDDGSVFRGKVNNKDVGVMQINEKYHAKRAAALGIDIYSVEGNLQYAKLLFDEQGSQPWISSSPCWGKYTTVAMK